MEGRQRFSITRRTFGFRFAQLLCRKLLRGRSQRRCFHLFICRPVTLKIIQKRHPIERQVILLKILEREGEAMVYTDQGWCFLGQRGCQPLRDTSTAPVLTQSRRRWHFEGKRCAVRSWPEQKSGPCASPRVFTVAKRRFHWSSWREREPHDEQRGRAPSPSWLEDCSPSLQRASPRRNSHT
jgi:hypothetical protein